MNKRELQWQKNNLLLQHITGDKDVEIGHTTSGKPFCRLFKSISISHSADYTAIMMSDAPSCSVDIQVYRERTTQALDYFMSANEIAEISQSDFIKNAHLYWCAKETVIKYFDLSGIDFKNKIYIAPFSSAQQGKIKAMVSAPHHFGLEITYQIADRYALCFAG